MNTNIVFSKARYFSGDEVVFSINEKVNEELSLQRETQVINNFTFSIKKQENKIIYYLSDLEAGSYIITIGEYQGAFSVDTKVNESVLYGFLSDFDKPSSGKEIASLCRLHINTVQFYDWMYRHDNLISDVDEYIDPLGRKINLNIVKDKVNKCNQVAMRPFAYGAIYSATEKIFSKNPQWGLYTIDDKPLKFANWLYYMDISKDSGWSNYITEEFLKAIREVGFKGIHMDTYGFPKTGCDIDGNIVFLDDEIPHLMQKVQQTLYKESPENGIIFNAVNDWPMEKVSNCSDAAYIEVWPPHVSYYDLFLLIKKAKLLGHKNVVLACYMEPFKDKNQTDRKSVV